MTSTIPDTQDLTTSDWPGSPLSAIHPLVPAMTPIPLEQYAEGNYYVMRLELPGINSGDIKVSVQTGILSVQAERQDRPPAEHDSEFHYGTYARHVTLPLRANVRAVTASYGNGILTIRIGIEPDHDAGPCMVPVTEEADHA